MMVSIFIPVYNGETYIAPTLDSLLTQTYRDFEVIVVDDSSSDNSFHILQDYSSRDARIKIYQKSNGGDVPHSWQYVMPYLIGEFTLYMSQDDLLLPHTLEKLVKRQKETNADAVIPSLTWYYGEKQPSKTDCGIKGDVSPILSGKEAFELMMDYSIPGFALWRTDIIKSNPVPMTAFNSDEFSQRDWCSKCHIIAFSDGEFLYRQNNPNAITKQFTDKQLEAAITDAMVLKLAVEIGVPKDRVIRYANDKYEDLWFYSIWFTLNKQNYSQCRKKQLMRLFSNAYQIIHHYVTLSHWKYKWSSINLCFFWAVIYLKAMRSKIIKKPFAHVD